MPTFSTTLRHRLFALTVSVSVLSLPLHAFAQGAVVQSFSDVPPSNVAFAAVEYLKAKGIVQGSNGKFDPNGVLTRAQLVKILVAQMTKAEEIAALPAPGFSDVPPGAWFEKYITAAVMMGIVDGPGKSPTFNPDKPVSRAAFMKMLFASKKIDAMSMFSNITGSLSSDVPSTGWEYPWMRAAITHTVVAVNKDNKLTPSDNVQRYQMALFIYRYDMYTAGRRAQAGLSETENNIVIALQKLDAKDIAEAEYASTRARLTALGALAIKPNEPIVKGAVKTAEGFEKLVLGYKAGSAGDLNATIQYAKDAYSLADKARTFSPALETIASQMQKIAKAMADEARKTQAAPAATAQ